MRRSPFRLAWLLLLTALIWPASAPARFGGGIGHFPSSGGGGGGFGGRGFGHGFGFPHIFFFGGGGGGFFSVIITLLVIYLALRVLSAAYRAYRQRGSAGGPGGAGPGSFRSASPTRVPSLQGRRELRRVQETRRQVELATADDEYWDPDALDARTRECFLAVQDAWRLRNPSLARPYVSDALFTRIEMQLEGMARQGRFDRLEDLRLDGAHLVQVYNVTDDSEDRFVVHLRGSARDWIEDARGQLVDGSREVGPFTEYWTFARHPDRGWVVDEVQQEAEGAYHVKAANVNRDEGPAVFER